MSDEVETFTMVKQTAFLHESHHVQTLRITRSTLLCVCHNWSLRGLRDMHVADVENNQSLFVKFSCGPNPPGVFF